MFYTYELTKRQIVATLRSPVFVFMGIVSPLLYLTLYAPILKNAADERIGIFTTFIPGILVMVCFSSGLFSGFGIVNELRLGIIERFRVTPTSRFSIVAGPVFCDLFFMFFQTLFFIAATYPFGFRISFLSLLLLYLLLSFLVVGVSALSNTIGILTKSEKKVAPIVHGIHLPILLLSGVLLPISFAPKPIQFAAKFNPIYYVVEAARALVQGCILCEEVVFGFLVTIPLSLLSFWIGAKVFRKAVM
jgi:ABC-2 type transport system permease protein